jgi:hypothetical protein
MPFSKHFAYGNDFRKISETTTTKTSSTNSLTTFTTREQTSKAQNKNDDQRCAQIRKVFFTFTDYKEEHYYAWNAFKSCQKL